MPCAFMRFGRIAFAMTLIGVAAAMPVATAQPSASTDGTSGAPLRIVVPFPPGTSLDILARDLAKRLQTPLGRPVFVENKAGAGGNLGTESVVQSAPDGSTILLTAHNPITINPLIYEKLKFNPLTDLVPIANLVQGGYLLATGPTSTFHTVAELITAAKQKPGALSYASYGFGSMAHICMEQFQRITGTQFQHVPYKGPFAPDLMGGVVDVAFENLTPSIQLVQTKRITALAVTHKRVRPLPDTPAISEAIPSFECYSWVGVFAPKGTSAAFQQKLSDEITRIAQSPSYTEMADVLGGVPAPMAQKQFIGFVKADAEKWKKLVPSLNIKLD